MLRMIKIKQIGHTFLTRSARVCIIIANMKHGQRRTDPPALCDKNDLEYYIDKYQDMESCYR